ncbi:magnesium transporter MgtE N-terminal domain-containing protein [Streptomyces sp. NPDC057239]|uniref:magnesium transporter MgtE N-terminal domain-containing protein n=1 Tax=Streptomyces sp. NPDC057239 TaxID=3346061 RepID=UPI003641C4B6
MIPDSHFSGEVRLEANASGNGRVYQVAQGQMHIHNADPARQLELMPLAHSVDVLTNMDPIDAAAALSAMSPVSASKRLEAMYVADGARIFAQLSDDVISTQMSLIQHGRLLHLTAETRPEKIGAALALLQIRTPDVVRILAEVHQPEKVVASAPPKAAVRWMISAGLPLGKTWFGKMSDQSAATLLSNMPLNHSIALIQQVSPGRAAEILNHLEKPKPSTLLKKISPYRAAEIQQEWRKRKMGPIR